MELYKELLTKLLAEYCTDIHITGLNVNISELFEAKCYHVLQEIKAIIKDDSFDDYACFRRIEQIIDAMEATGSECGFRHKISPEEIAADKSGRR